jgi:hypothetical protein
MTLRVVEWQVLRNVKPFLEIGLRAIINHLAVQNLVASILLILCCVAP